MRKITNNELSDSLNNKIDNLQNAISLELMTESNTIVGAINELYGKDIIANSIGEPLNNTDTYNKMSNDINSLLNTFKTNMMNAGVAIESGDKFKSLIDKIATMVKEGSGKGIYIESGIVTSDRNGGLTIPLQFEPIVVFTYQNETGTNGITYPTIYGKFDDNILSIRTYSSGGTTAASMITSRYTNGSFTTSTITGNMSCTYYAIGVGEEDTTLRDSLASILTEEGVSVTEEDDMASLISKTDNQFNSLNTTITLLNNQVNSLTNELAGKVTPAGTAVAANVLSGKTFINSTGQVVTGTMNNYGSHTYVANYVGYSGTAVYMGIQPGAYLTPSAVGYPEIYINNTDLDPNLVPENIVSGKSICGVAGTAPKGYKFISGTGATLYSGNVYSGSPGASQVIDIKGYDFWFNGVVKVSSYISDSGSTATGNSIGSYTIELYNSSGTLKSSDKYDGLKNTTVVKDYTVSVGDYFRYKPDNRASYGSGIFRMNVIIQVSLTTV